MVSVQVLTYGVRKFGSTASVLQGAGSDFGCPGTVRPSPHWSAKMLAGKMLPHAVVPPLTQDAVWCCQLEVRVSPFVAEPPGTFSLSTPMLPGPGVITCVLPATHGFAEQTTVLAPVGTWFNPSALATAVNKLKGSCSYMMLPPPRMTVFPLPCMSQAKPTRGEKLL